MITKLGIRKNYYVLNLMLIRIIIILKLKCTRINTLYTLKDCLIDKL